MQDTENRSIRSVDTPSFEQNKLEGQSYQQRCTDKTGREKRTKAANRIDKAYIFLTRYDTQLTSENHPSWNEGRRAGGRPERIWTDNIKEWRGKSVRLPVWDTRPEGLESKDTSVGPSFVRLATSVRPVYLHTHLCGTGTIAAANRNPSEVTHLPAITRHKCIIACPELYRF